MLGQVGPMLSHLGPILGLCWAKSGPCWAMLGPSWAYIGPGWAYVGLCWGAHVGPMWPKLSPLGSYVGAMFGWNDPKMPFFPPRASSWSPKQRKDRRFLTSPRWNPLLPKGPKHRKKWCFWTPQAKYTVNYRDFSRGEHRVGRRQGWQPL